MITYFRPGSKYRHRACLDTDIEIVTVFMGIGAGLNMQAWLHVEYVYQDRTRGYLGVGDTVMVPVSDFDNWELCAA